MHHRSDLGTGTKSLQDMLLSTIPCFRERSFNSSLKRLIISRPAPLDSPNSILIKHLPHIFGNPR